MPTGKRQKSPEIKYLIGMKYYEEQNKKNGNEYTIENVCKEFPQLDPDILRWYIRATNNNKEERKKCWTDFEKISSKGT